MLPASRAGRGGCAAEVASESPRHKFRGQLESAHSCNLNSSIRLADREDGAKGWSIEHTQSLTQRSAFSPGIACKFAINFR